MSPESTHNDDRTFLIDHIPGTEPIRLQHGHLLEEGKHRLAEIFEAQADHVSSEKSIAMTTRALRQAGYGLLQIPGKLLTLHNLGKTETPHDREYVRLRNEKAQDFVEDFIGKLVTDDSSVHGIENLTEAVAENRKGNPVIQMGNHGSEMDPVLQNILLKKKSDELAEQDPTSAETIMETREKLLAVIGHKVMLEKFRRAFAGSVHSLFTIATKYRNNLSSEDATLANAYVSNVNTILRELISNPEYFVMLFPEGGRTRNAHIGMQMSAIQAATKKLILPTFIQAPENFLEVEHGERIDVKPAKIDMYYGKPYIPNEEGNRRGNVVRFIRTFRDNLGEAGAPVDEYEWGYMQPEKRRGNMPRTQKFTEVT